MPPRPTGSIIATSAGFSARVRAGKERPTLPMVIRDEAEAQARANALAGIARRLVLAGIADPVSILRVGAAKPPGRAWEEHVAAVERVLAGKAAVIGTRGTTTLATLAKDWFSGELARRYPDHVREKRSSEDDRRRFELHVSPLLGARPVDSLRLSDCDAVMSALPPDLRPATRRQVAQVLHRLLAMAVYPCRLRSDNPIPKGWLPRVPNDTIKEALYPDEDAKLLACPDVPLLRRLCYGFLAREGMRRSEALGLRWRDLDLEHGFVSLDRTKTDEPRSWALDEGVRRALAAWRKLGDDPGDDEHVFAEQGVPLNDDGLAKVLRRDLLVAGVDRPALFDSTGTRVAIRVHDLRATFVTIALAAGKSEAWVTDRTGHTSSQMLARYRRRARKLAERGMVWLRPLDEALGIGRKGPGLAIGAADGAELARARSQNHGSAAIDLLSQRSFNPSVPGSSPGQPTSGSPNDGQSGPGLARCGAHTGELAAYDWAERVLAAGDDE